MSKEYIPSKEVIDILEKNGFSVDCKENHVTIQQYTDLGQDWFEEFYNITSDEVLTKNLLISYNNFDVDEEVETFIPVRGTHGVPSSISDLVDDARWKENKLDKITTELNNLIIDRSLKTRKYNTIEEVVHKGLNDGYYGAAFELNGKNHSIEVSKYSDSFIGKIDNKQLFEIDKNYDIKRLNKISTTAEGLFYSLAQDIAKEHQINNSKPDLACFNKPLNSPIQEGPVL